MEIVLEGRTRIPILHEDRSVLVLDKPAGWMLAPRHWVNTRRNLLLALDASIAAGDHWARSRGLRFLRHVHRLDAETTGALLFVKHPRAMAAYSRLFESRQVEKVYWALVDGQPRETEWMCSLPLAPHPDREGVMVVNLRSGKVAHTGFRVLEGRLGGALIEARPVTGRTHQIRVHLLAARCPIRGDTLYGRGDATGALALRAVGLHYRDPFTRQVVNVEAPVEAFLQTHDWATRDSALRAGPRRA